MKYYLSMSKQIKKRIAVFTILAIVLSFLCISDMMAYAASTANSQTGFSIDFLDVGQADAAIIRCDGKTMMIDGGNANDSGFIYSYLKQHNIAAIDTMICTHPHEDHAGGLAGALNAAMVGTAYSSVAQYDSNSFLAFTKYLAKQNKSVTVAHHGDNFSVGSASVSIIGPIYPELETDLNNTSVVAKMQYGNTSFLFTGDAGIDEELEIIGAGYDVSADVLKIGHHGAEDSTCQTFLDRVNPQYAIISCGTNNSYGHPKATVINELKSKNITLYRTDLQGTITCSSDGTSITIQPSKNAGIDTLVPGVVSTTQSSANSGQAVVAETSKAAETSEAASVSAKYILNTNTHKFHIPTCSSVDDMKEKNKKAFEGTRDEAIAQGYVPCKRCNP